MKTSICKVEVVDGRVWAAMSVCRAPETSPVPDVLRWIVEQLNLSNFDETVDEEGRLTSLVIGAAAAPPIDDQTLQDVARQVDFRLRAVNIAGLFANSREEGVEPVHAKLTKEVQQTIQPGGRDNTSFHYAFQLLDILDRISDTTFIFDAPPIKTKAGPGVVTLLKEATRAYLFGLGRSCVCVCRALLEAALRERVSQQVLVREQLTSKKGELESLITIAVRDGRLTEELGRLAHDIRKTGNRTLHGTGPSDPRAWEVLSETRTVVSALYA